MPSTGPVPYGRDDVAAAGGGAPPHGLVVEFAWVGAETMIRAHGPHGHEGTHNRDLYVVGDGQERAQPVSSFTGRDAAGVAEGAAEVGARVPGVTPRVLHEGHADRPGHARYLHVRLDRLQCVLKFSQQPGLRVETRLEL